MSSWGKADILQIVKISKLPFGEPDTDFIIKLHGKGSQIKEFETHISPWVKIAYELQSKICLPFYYF